MYVWDGCLNLLVKYTRSWVFDGGNGTMGNADAVIGADIVINNHTPMCMITAIIERYRSSRETPLKKNTWHGLRTRGVPNATAAIFFIHG